MSDQVVPRTVAAVLFEGFELLDVFGPLELFGLLPGNFRLVLVGPEAGPVSSAQGPKVLVERPYRTAPVPEIVLVPGGRGTRPLVRDPAFLNWLGPWAEQASLVASVCTGAGLLAAAGLLDGRRATSNKRSFAWVRAQRAQVEWVAEARWVADGARWTSAGIAAGMDMSLAIIASLHGIETARNVAVRAELDWHEDPSWDPFAALNGLVTE